MAALSVYPSFDVHCYELTARALSTSTPPEWGAFVQTGVQGRVIEQGREAGTYEFRSDYSAWLQRERDALGGERAVVAALLEAWVPAPSKDLVSQVSAWARELERWDVLAKVWAAHGEDGGLPVSTLEIFRDLPPPARESHPILTWASGAATSLMAQTPGVTIGIVWDRLLLDSAMLHASWASRSETDTAVQAGTFRMIGEQCLPSTRAGRSLDAAWQTKLDIDAFIDARSRAGQGPGRTSHAVFRAFSARLALFRADPSIAVNEARWARILSDWEPAATLAAGIEALARSASSEATTVSQSEPSPRGVHDGLKGRGLRGMGQTYEILAIANEAVRALDRDRVDRCLEMASPMACALTGVGAVRASIDGMRSALWGDPDIGLRSLANDITHLARVGREQDEPNGQALLSRTQIVLLVKAGATFAAAKNVAAMAEESRSGAQAWIELWAGQYRRAVELADNAPYRTGQEIGEVRSLSLVRAAAGLLDDALDADLRRAAIREMGWLVHNGAFVHLATLPRVARDALIELTAPELNASEPNFSVLLARLNHLNDSGRQHCGPVTLTGREQVLLPLLATNGTVPAIAQQLHVSPNTVRKQVATLKAKFGASSRAQLIHKARRLGALRAIDSEGQLTGH